MKSALAVVGAAVLVSAGLSMPIAASAAPAAPTVPSISKTKLDALKYPAGTYVVTLKEKPAATYTGGITGYRATKAAKGTQLDAHATAVTSYSKFLATRQNALAKAVGAKVLYNYSVAYNGFGAHLTSEQASRLAASKDVQSVVKAENLHVEESHSLDFLNVSTPGGTWDQIGGAANAGEGIVVGDVDTGIAPENPSFAGDPLGTDATTGAPYLDGSTIKFQKADGGTFSSSLSTDTDQWSDADYSTKIIAAHAYVSGFGLSATGVGHDVGEYNSPRDGAGHGSHTASTAAGDHGVEASVQGQDFGTISGVAPAAKLAIYKVCWSGPDPTVETDDGCNTIDMLAAINQAVLDGVDVINFSIGGGSATTTYSPTDAAFLNATAAGIFVAAAGGNDGPGASTLDNAAPWETTVAASTIPDYEGTIELGNDAKYVGAGITVESDVTGPVVNAEDHPGAGKTAADANLCLAGSLGDVTGDIVVCDRGNNARVDKSAEVERAGGIGMILVNVPGGADDTDNDFHSVPSVHTFAKNHDAIHAYAATTGATATLVPGNTTGVETPVPQIAGFSSHGPVLAAGSDVLKPDVSAPGVSILAAVANAQGEDPKWDFYSGTSMATPHITGLAALYLGEHPTATPAEIKSAMMTGATNLVDADGNDVTDPFTQGAGEVHPATYLNPGLYYPAGIDDWKSYIVGTDQVTDYSPYVDPLDFTGVTAIDPSNLNQASIAIGDLIGTQTVTRTVTAQTAGTYTASIDVPGITATVAPASITLAKGASATFKVTFSRSDAEPDAWTSGFLTWTSTGAEPITVRSPVAIHPTSVLAPATVSGTGATGSAAVTITGGFDGDLPLTSAGLIKGDRSTGDDPTTDYTDIADVDDPDGYRLYAHQIAAGTTSVEFDVFPTVESADTDLDLAVLYTANGTGSDFVLVGQSATSSGSESVTVANPKSTGLYVTEVDFYATPAGGIPYTEVAYADNPDDYVGDFATPASVQISTGDDSTYTATWKGLDPLSLYKGTVSYGEGAVSTSFDVVSGVSATKAPVLNGVVGGSKPQPGHTLQVQPATWDVPSDELTYTYRWTANGKGISGATGASYLVPSFRAGQTIGVTVTATHTGGIYSGTSSDTTPVKYGSTSYVTLGSSSISTSQTANVRLTLKVTGGSASGTMTLHYGSKTKSVKVSGGTASTTLPKLAKGTYDLYAVYGGNSTVWSGTSAHKSLKVS